MTDHRVLDSVLRALDFVEERMGLNIGVQDMAKASYYSLFYFSRIFAQATGHAPYDYLMRRRVAAAAEDIVTTDRSLTEIALDRGFDVPDSFARAFRRCFGMAPSEARRERGYPRAVARTRIDRGYASAMLESPPGRPVALDSEDSILSGIWLSDSVKTVSASPDSRILTERGGDLLPLRSFTGVEIINVPETGTAPGNPYAALPEYPLSATRVPAGRRMRFPVNGSASRLSMILEFAYRSWLPYLGITKPPAFDIVEMCGSGISALELPLYGSSGVQ